MAVRGMKTAVAGSRDGIVKEFNEKLAISESTRPALVEESKSAKDETKESNGC